MRRGWGEKEGRTEEKRRKGRRGRGGLSSNKGGAGAVGAKAQFSGTGLPWRSLHPSPPLWKCWAGGLSMDL